MLYFDIKKWRLFAGRSLVIAMLSILLVAMSSCSQSAPANKEVILATTTSTYDTGLLDVLAPDFQKKTGYVVKPIAVGTGQALALGERGEADVLLVHAPSAEKKLIESGAAIDRRLVMHNSFAIVGPPSDPVGIKGGRDAALAFKKIAASNVLFISRADDSGTDKMEKDLWNRVGASPDGQRYLETGQGMGATLRIASEKGGYTLTDRGTFLSQKKTLSLEVMVEGDPSLLNIYSVMLVNPEKYPKVNAQGARAFADYIVSRETQSIIKSFGLDKFGEALFMADAGKQEEDL